MPERTRPHVDRPPPRRRNLRLGEAIDSMILAVVGGVGLIAGASMLRTPPVVPQAAPVIAPPATGWPAMATTSDRVVRYTLEAKLDPGAHTIEGKGTIAFRNASSAPLRDLRFHLYLNAFKNTETVFRRARVGGFRGDTSSAPGLIDVKRLALDGVDLWPKHEVVSHKGESPQDPLRRFDPPPFADAPDDETDVRVPLPRDIAPGETITLDVEFHDELPAISERTGYHGSFHFAGQWFPKLARLEPDGRWASFAFHRLAEFYADYGTYDVTIDAPASFVLAASGPTVESRVVDGRRIERHVIDDVHDFAWTAWDKFVVREAIEGPVHIRALGPPGYDDAIEREIASAIHGLRDLGARFGAYPYPILTIVHPPAGAEEAGGMEYPTLITTGGKWWPAHGSREIEAVTIHELGHQWFYGLVGTHEVEWPAGDEGFNSYGETLAMETLFGSGSLASMRAIDFSLLARARVGASPPFDEPIFQPAYAFAHGRSYGTRVYLSTTAALLTLRRTYGATSFDAAMGAYARRFRFRHPTPADFFASLNQLMGPDCAAAAIAALTAPATLDYYVERVTSTKREQPGGVFDPSTGRTRRPMHDEAKEGATRWQNAAWIGRHGVVDLPVDVELRFGDGTRRRDVVRFGASPGGGGAEASPGGVSWRRIDSDGPSPLTAVVVDPDFKIALDLTRTNNFKSAERGGGTPVTRERAFAWIEGIARLVGP